MSPDAVVEKLSLLGVQMTRRTVLNYENAGLITKAERGGGGTGGRWANYNKIVIAEIYSAWSLIHGQYAKHDIDGLNELFDNKPPKFTPKIISIARELFIAKNTVNEVDLRIKEILDANNGSVNIPEVEGFKELLEEQERVMLDHKKVRSKIPKGVQSLILWVEQLWTQEKNRATLLEEQLIKTLE